MSIDLGTGDGRLPYAQAREQPERLFVGIDANAANLRDVSTRAARAGLANLLYVRAAVEDLPPELDGAADRVTVVLPWGSLLAALARPSRPILHRIREVCQPRATLTVILGIDPARDQAEAFRLGLPPLDLAHFEGPLAAEYAAAGLDITSVRPIGPDELATWPSSWAKRLAHGRARSVFRIDARRSPSTTRPP